MLQPPGNNNPQDDRTKHKYMVQWVVVPNTYTDNAESFVSKHIVQRNIILFLYYILVETRCGKLERSTRFKIDL